MKNMKVRSKLIVSFLIAILLSLAVGGLGAWGTLTVSGNESSLYTKGVKGTYNASGMYSVLVEQRLELRGMIIDIDRPEVVRACMDALRMREDEFTMLYQDLLAAMPEIADNPDLRQALEVYGGAFAAIKTNLLAAFDAGDNQAMMAEYRQVAQAALQVTDGLYKVMAEVDQTAARIMEADSQRASVLIAAQFALVAVCAAAAFCLSLYLSGLIGKPLLLLASFMRQAGERGDLTLRPEDVETIGAYAQVKDEIGQCINSCAAFIRRVTEVSRSMETVAGGDLTVQTPTLSDRDVMGRSLNGMAENLNRMFGEIRLSTAQVSSGSKQIADGAQLLAQGSTQQAASVEELSASISEIAGKTHENSEMAGRAAQLAGVIKRNAETGSSQMDQMMRAVQDINQASQDIGKVIKVIDDIAFQTNILALNAAVEAARAGQHGKGFAVVAEEVRNLAAKSAEAAKDTGGLIQNSIAKAELGTQIAGATAASLREIVSGIGESDRLVSDIAKLSEQQSLGLRQIHKGIDQVAQVVQQNSATAEQSAAASEEMSGQASLLEGLMAQFRLKGTAVPRLGGGR